MSNSFEVNLMETAAALIADAGIGRWQANGSYTSGTLPAIFIRVMPESPDDAITLSTYTVQPGVSPDDEVIGLQILVRRAGKDPRRVDELAEAIRQVFHNRRSFGDIPISHCALQSGASLGLDSNYRWSWSSNYYITTSRPTPHFH